MFDEINRLVIIFSLTSSNYIFESIQLDFVFIDLLTQFINLTVSLKQLQICVRLSMR
ncbi:hypothetical protein KYG_12894 [Acidovorax sp. NO-1]|nr:hypothetical protein KYG_12894 [Acidovorax sp. NO-1]